MRARRLLTSDHEATREIWPAFTDVMSTMALVLFVLVLLAYVRNLLASRQLDALQARIATSEASLRHVDAEVASARAALASSQSKLRDQEAVIAEAHRELGAVQSRLQSIAVLRVDVLEKLKKAIEAELGPRTDAGTALVSIGNSGDLLVNESLVFESGSYAIKPGAKPLLDGLARALGSLLADDAVRDDIDAVVIQGHTDSRGSAEYNWDLSARRATAVVDYLFRANPTLAETYGRYFAASAYSKFRPIDTGASPDALERNRRIEISVVPRDAKIREIIDDYMEGLPPSGP